MEESTQEFKTIYSPITTEEQALKVNREAAMGFLIIALLQLVGAVIYTISYSSLISGMFIILLTGLLYKYQSRAVAIIFVFLTTADFVYVMVYLPTEMGAVWFLKVAAIIISVRAFQATSYLRKVKLLSV